MTNSFPGTPDRRDGAGDATPLHDQTAGQLGEPGFGQPGYGQAPGQRDYRPTQIPATPGAPLGQPDGKADAAKQEAQRVAGEAKDAAGQVAGAAKDEVKHLAGEAKDQAKGLLGQAKSALDGQTRAQHERAAGGIRTLADDMDRVARGEQPENDLVTNAVQQLSSTVGQAASWLEQREPKDLLEEAQRFARRNPVTFLAIAAGLGLVAGRVTRGLIGNPELGGKDEAEAPRAIEAAPLERPGRAALADQTLAARGVDPLDPYAQRARAEAADAMPAPEFRGPQVPDEFDGAPARSPFEGDAR